jgi:hypothetical protein
MTGEIFLCADCHQFYYFVLYDIYKYKKSVFICCIKSRERIIASLNHKETDKIPVDLDAVGKYIDIIQVNDDPGTQNGLQISAEIYREMIKPFIKNYGNIIKQKSGKPLILHSCDSIY